MPLKAVEDFNPEPLRFPIGGKVYEVPEIGYEAGIKLQGIESGEVKDVKAEDQWRLLMGPAFDEMRADNVPIRALNRAVLTCLTDYRTGNRELAEQVWEVGLDPEALAPKGATEKDSTATGEASTTPSPASTSGTTSKAPASSTDKPKGSRSRKSANSGDSSQPTS